MAVRPAKIKISLGIRPVWSESSLFAWRKLGSLATQWAHSEDSYQTGRMPRLIWVFAGGTVTLFVLSCLGSFVIKYICLKDILSFMSMIQQYSSNVIETARRDITTHLTHKKKMPVWNCFIQIIWLKMADTAYTVYQTGK